MRSLKLRHLRIVLAVSEAESLAQAAERLHVTAAAVSKALAEVEEVFGAAVFDRGRGWVRLTPLGRAVLASARVVGSELAGLSDVVQGLQGGYQGELAIGTKAVSLHPFLANTINAFAAHYPQVRISLVEGTSKHLRDLLDDGRIQLLFARLSPDIVHSGLQKAAILTDDVVVAASADHPLAGRADLDWPELVGQRWCLPVPGTLMRDHLERLLGARRLGLPQQYVETSDMTMVAPLFRLGPYVTLVPRRVAEHHLKLPVGCILPLDVPAATDSVGMIWNEALPTRPTARLFRELVLRQLADRPAVQAPSAQAVELSSLTRS
ncbi:LysR family transcriptional regulator [Variovorax terrae]|uniref:LysR family transcriptional regulator n=1 Tax=Variovorax terrae TaxID=2923278 RepID=A0A9X1VU29_9BURK|nr:LysR family transcriptional regulator [Variovorax terrae]MCJ0763314.1 LysR family transcriptional regulator [Variovorax terrae]